MDQFRTRVYSKCCVYCGDVATTDEHFPPQTFGCRGLILRACHECNSAIGTYHPTHFSLRAKHLKLWLAKRYRRYLKAPAWTEDELDEMGPNLRRSIEAGAEIAAHTRKRLEWDAVAYVYSLEPEACDFVW